MKSLRQKYSDWLERKAELFHDIVLRHRKEKFHSSVGFIAPTASISVPDYCSAPEKLFFEDQTSLDTGARFIISPRGEKGIFIMKPHSYAAAGLTVISGNHPRQIGMPNRETAESHEYDVDKDIIVEEDAGIGAGVTLLAGVKVGRGATIGAGSVCVNNVPPYAIVMGNPAQVVGFVFTPEQIIEHEKALYPESERLPLSKLEKNYQRYYLNHIADIAKFTKISI